MTFTYFILIFGFLTSNPLELVLTLPCQLSFGASTDLVGDLSRI